MQQRRSVNNGVDCVPKHSQIIRIKHHKLLWDLTSDGRFQRSSNLSQRITSRESVLMLLHYRKPCHFLKSTRHLSWSIAQCSTILFLFNRIQLTWCNACSHIIDVRWHHQLDTTSTWLSLEKLQLPAVPSLSSHSTSDYGHDWIWIHDRHQDLMNVMLTEAWHEHIIHEFTNTFWPSQTCVYMHLNTQRTMLQPRNKRSLEPNLLKTPNRRLQRGERRPDHQLPSKVRLLVERV